MPGTHEPGKTELQELHDLVSVLGTAVGLARHYLREGYDHKALAALDDAARKAHEVRFDALVEQGFEPGRVASLMGPRDA